MPTNYKRVPLPDLHGLDYRFDNNKSPLIAATNVKVNADKSVERLSGWSLLLDTPISVSSFTTNIFNWRLENGTVKYIAVCDGYLWDLDFDESTATKIDTTQFIQGYRIGIAAYGDNIYYGDGNTTYNRVYNNSSARNMGGAYPTAAPTLNTTGTDGSLTQLGTYVYAYSYYDSTNGKETGLSDTFTYTLTGADDRVDLNLTNPASTGTNFSHMRVYRTTSGGSTLYRTSTDADGEVTIADWDGSTVVYQDSTADGSLGTQQTVLGYEYFPACAMFAMQNNRLYGAGNATTPRRMWESVLFNPDYVDTGATQYYKDFDTRITGIAKIPFGLLVFERDSTWLLSGSKLENMEPTKFSSVAGAQNQSAIAYMDEGIVLWSSVDTVYMWDGSSPKDVGAAVSPKIRDDIVAGTVSTASASMVHNPTTKLSYWVFG